MVLAQSVITKLFVSNLPEGCTPWELRKCMEDYGEIAGTYVAKKRDKDGCRFGFASFKEVKDRKELLKSLTGVKMGDFKLKVNIARYAVENSGSDDRPEVMKNSHKASGQDHSGRVFNLRGARSYSDVVGKSCAAGGFGLVPDVPKSVGLQDSRKYVVVPDRAGALRSLFGVAFIGRTVDLETLVDFDKLIAIAIIPVANFQYLGGLSLLISFHDGDSARKFFDSKGIWGLWFSKLDPWSGQTLPFERMAWLRLNEIPLHLYDPEVMTLVGEIFGKVLHVPKVVEDDADLSFCRIGVLCGESGRIMDSVSLRWNNRSFRVWVEEELEVWVPDCLASKGSDDRKSTMSSPVVDLQSSGEMGNEGVQEKVGGEEDGGTLGVNSSHAVPFPMHEVRENVGLNVFEVAECQMEERDGLGNLKDDGGAGSGNRRLASGRLVGPVRLTLLECFFSTLRM
ncbi:putative RNA recognition motif domain, nucleotide-binding alpha-beta plait domain superfamily [Helianthus annuus]|uniref:RNA recognition motif domain, nucleotide-binding alpha-beta plait domain superfamily n=1 Tax=Helianthus annuus TaxID=4232 RepID=A0A9K3J6C7_HELAN|nr:putative RNA recognition motif domain, nucleotide-binding alpha-beta plait domain superfamily [Helianthus annuus]KAJ0580659.1 putative RNA recognition motif domain, nucleotide-binding alpha-beta plait domain superfamily [Helianthus annuus]KAJ0596610.1 putative RNA recognition motif domain, nucleotide-binding alpha-beta plait domain superfamily [Helianthus annuus]KAJ0757275.1 putative RNA recognition motif domain, nucleotide-binding alpha-beta plait domain superfamily [Helianthus annuus]KAJ07